MGLGCGKILKEVHCVGVEKSGEKTFFFARARTFLAKIQAKTTLTWYSVEGLDFFTSTHLDAKKPVAADKAHTRRIYPVVNPTQNIGARVFQQL